MTKKLAHINPNLKAFTLLEMLVVMVLTGIVFGIGYTTYDLMHKQFAQYESHHEELLRLEQLKTLLKTDFFEARKITKNHSGIRIEQMEETIAYLFENEHIIRLKMGVNDTFHYPTGEVNMFYEKQRQDFQEALIDQLSVEVVYKGQSQTLSFLKKYDAALKMSQELN